ncbi:hypothetical protein BGZ73_008569 [Actinomortierella ambigua]|nr:hypothetical protein BGZ73_008569 [Actinomortierella ambigua]
MTAVSSAMTPELMESGLAETEIEKLVIRALRKLVEALSNVDDQTEPSDPTDGDEDTDLTETLAIPSLDNNSAANPEDPGVDFAQDPSTETGGDPVDPVGEPAPSTPIQQLQNELAASFHSEILREVRETLQNNDCIQREALLFGEPVVDDNKIKFWLSPEGYEEWLKQHQAAIQTNFIFLKGSYKFISKKRAGNQHMYLQCQRAGKKRENKGSIRGGKSGKPRVRKASMKIGCPAKLQVLTQQRPGPDGVLQTVYEVTYQYQHNHGVGCFSSEGTRQKADAIRATIKRLILHGSAISMAMQKLTMEHDKFTQILRRKVCFSRDDFITYDDIYNIWHGIMVTRMRKDDDPVVSSIKWMEELDKDGAFTYYDKNDRVAGLYFGFSTTWQMNQLKAQRQNLFTLVVKNTSTGRGIPVAFLLTSTTESSVLIGWLRGLRSKMAAIFSTPYQAHVYKPNAVITDQGNEEILAIKSAFAGEASVSELRSILKERDMQKALESIQQYRDKWGTKYKQDELLRYLDTNFFGPPGDVQASTKVQKHWMTCYRQGVSYSLIDASSYIEHWHNILKRHFFRDRHQGRHDAAIYILTYMVLPHFQQICSRDIPQVSRITPVQKIEERYRSAAAKHLENRESLGFERDPVEQIDDNTLRVESFTTPDKFYEIPVDFSKDDSGEITSCSCEHFCMHRGCCKHIALALLLIPQMRMRCIENDLQASRAGLKRTAPEIAQRDYDDLMADSSTTATRSVYQERVFQLESIRDSNVAWRNQAEIDALYVQIARLIESELDDDMSAKRQRQTY